VIRSVLFFEHKSLYASKGPVPDGEVIDQLALQKFFGREAT